MFNTKKPTPGFKFFHQYEKNGIKYKKDHDRREKTTERLFIHKWILQKNLGCKKNRLA